MYFFKNIYQITIKINNSERWLKLKDILLQELKETKKSKRREMWTGIARWKNIEEKKTTSIEE